MLVGRSRTDSVSTFLKGRDGIEDLVDQLTNTRLFGWVRSVGRNIEVGYAGDPVPAEIYVLEGTDAAQLREASRGGD